MNCREIEKLLQLYHDGELSAEETRLVESHLSKCPDCRAALAKLSALDALIKDGKAEKVPDPGKHYWQSFSHRVIRRLSTHRPSLRRPPSRTKLFRFGLIPYLSAGAAIVLALVVSFTMLKEVPSGFTEEDVSAAKTETKAEEGESIDATETETGVEEMDEPQGIVFGAEIEEKTEVEDDRGHKDAEEPVLSLPRADTDVKPSGDYIEIEPSKVGTGTVTESRELTTDEEEVLEGRGNGGLFGKTAKNVAKEAPTLAESMRYQTPFSPVPGTLKVVVDSMGRLESVTVKTTSGSPEADSMAVRAYKEQWAGQTFRQRRAMLLVPFEETDTTTSDN